MKPTTTLLYVLALACATVVLVIALNSPSHAGTFRSSSPRMSYSASPGRSIIPRVPLSSGPAFSPRVAPVISPRPQTVIRSTPIYVTPRSVAPTVIVHRDSSAMDWLMLEMMMHNSQPQTTVIQQPVAAAPVAPAPVILSPSSVADDRDNDGSSGSWLLALALFLVAVGAAYWWVSRRAPANRFGR